MNIERDKAALIGIGNRYTEKFKAIDDESPDAGDQFRAWMVELMMSAYTVGLSRALSEDAAA